MPPTKRAQRNKSTKKHGERIKTVHEDHHCCCPQSRKTIKIIRKGRDFFKRRGDMYQQQLREKEEDLLATKKRLKSSLRALDRSLASTVFQRTRYSRLTIRCKEKLLKALRQKNRLASTVKGMEKDFDRYETLLHAFVQALPSYDGRTFMIEALECLSRQFNRLPPYSLLPTRR